MKFQLTLLTLLLAVFTSCKKTTNIDVELSTSGKLTYRLTDDAGKGIPNVKVSLFDRFFNSNYLSSTYLLDSRLTDSNGQVDFGDLNPNNYLLTADSAKVNNVNYSIQDYVQVITGAVKHKETKVTDHSGTFILSVKSYNNNQPLKNVGVLMIPYTKWNYSSTTVSNLKVADFSGVTDEFGIIKFKIPANISYSAYVYNTVTNASFNYNNVVSLQKDATTTFMMTIYQP